MTTSGGNSRFDLSNSPATAVGSSTRLSTCSTRAGSGRTLPPAALAAPVSSAPHAAAPHHPAAGAGEGDVVPAGAHRLLEAEAAGEPLQEGRQHLLRPPPLL